MEEDIKILEKIIKGDEYCIQAIYNHNEKQKYNEEDEDIQHYKKEIKSVKNIINSYNKEKSRADKLEKDYSKSLTKIDKLEADLYSANSIINEQIDIINNSVDKDKIKEIKKKCELENMPCEIYKKESRNYWMNIGQISLCTRLLEGDE